MSEPLATPPAGGIVLPDEKPLNTKLLIPKNDAALAEVGRLLAATWEQEEWLTLRWKTQPAFAQLVTDFTTGLTERRSAATTRTPHSQRLQELDDQFDEGVRYLKRYVDEDNGYDRARTAAHLPSFGLITTSQGNGRQLARDREERRTALRDLLLPAVASASFAERPYGTAFWQPRFEEYESLLGQSEHLAGQVTRSVSQKDAGKKELRRVLQAIVYALKANFPDTFEAELRTWGFRKESY